MQEKGLKQAKMRHLEMLIVALSTAGTFYLAWIACKAIARIVGYFFS